ncbi:MAG: alanine racemase, partial [Deltaproteobacteria bacterium]|nr:alanine racemase [Candidatus Tharpellaceae bacterium]
QQHISPAYIHLANSAGIVRYLPGPCNLCRAGIMLYGSYPAAEFLAEVKLEPVMAVKTAIVMLKMLHLGESISYGCTYSADRETSVALIPVGYADGLHRKLSNTGFMLVGGRRVPIIGRVCMDWTMLDVTDVPGAAVGDEVVIIGRQGNEMITAEEMADVLETISYEVFCNWSDRVARIYHYG